MAERLQPVTQLVDAISVSVTPGFKAACQRAATKQEISLAEYARLALSERLTKDNVCHRKAAAAKVSA